MTGTSRIVIFSLLRITATTIDYDYDPAYISRSRIQVVKAWGLRL